MRRSDWPTAIMQLAAATQEQPDNFWAQCLLAICYLQRGASCGSERLERMPSAQVGSAVAFHVTGDRQRRNRRENQGRSAAQTGPNRRPTLFEDAEAILNEALDLIGDTRQACRPVLCVADQSRHDVAGAR